MSSDCRYVAYVRPAATHTVRSSESLRIVSNTTKITAECLLPGTEYIFSLTCSVNGVEVPGPIAVTNVSTKPYVSPLEGKTRYM